MSSAIEGIAVFLLNAALLVAMIAVFVRARQLDEQLRTIGRDREELRTLFDDVGKSVTAAIVATTRLRSESDKTVVDLAAACREADKARDRLDETINRASLPTEPAQQVRSTFKSSISPARIRSLPSRAERELAQALSGND